MLDRICTLDASAIAKPAALLAKLAAQRGSVPVLSYIRLELRGGALQLSATDLETWAAVDIPADTEAGARNVVLVAAHAFADAVKTIAKDKRARVELDYDAEASRVVVYSGRTRLAVQSLPPGDFPPTPEIEADAVFACEAGALEYRAGDRTPSKEAARLITGAAKALKADNVLIERAPVDGVEDYESVRFRAKIAGTWSIVSSVHAPSLYGATAKRDPFTYGMDWDAFNERQAYLRAYRATHGLPLVGSGDDSLGRLIEYEGRAVGLQLGGCSRDYNECREMPADWEPPAGSEITECPYIQGGEEFTLDGVAYVRMHAGAPWSQRHVAPVPGALIWDEGAYCVVMPLEQRTPVSALTVDVDGVPMPLKAKFDGCGAPVAIGLSADEVAELCGPIDPTTFLPIEALAFHHGRIIARGADAERFNRMRADFARNAHKALKNCRSTADAFLTASNIGESWAAKVAAFLETGTTALVLPKPPAAAVIAEPEPTEEAPAVADNVVAFKPAARGFAAIGPTRAAVPETPSDYAEVMPEPEEARADPVAVPEPVAEPVEAPAAIVPASDLERRLARLEQALGLVAAPKRTPAHAAAIRRAWRMRAEARRLREGARIERERAELSEAGAQCQRARADALQAQLNGDCRRIEAVEAAWTAERADLVAEIDRARAAAAKEADGLEHNARQAMRSNAARKRLARRAATLRRDLGRARAECSGMAANVQAMARRAADDAATIERLGGDNARPRFILNAR